MSEKKLRSQALKIFRAALDASDPAGAVLRHVRVSGRHAGRGPPEIPL